MRPRARAGPSRGLCYAAFFVSLVKTSILLATHRANGAVISNDAALRVLAYGDVPDEYRAARDGCALLDQTERELVAVSGPDASAFLQRLLANTVRTLGVGQGNRNLLLSSKGKVLFDFDLAVEPERTTLSLSSGNASGLLKALDTYHFTEKLTLADVSGEHAPVALIGPRAAEFVAAATGVRESLADHAFVTGSFEGAPVRVTSLPIAGSAGWRLDGGPALALELWNALRAAGAVPLGRVAYDSLRVEAAWAEFGVDVDDNVYPQEARLERAFALDKGCYIGQEVVAKIDTYGGLNKRMVTLRLDHDDPMPRGSRLFELDQGEWRDLGLLTSWAYSFELDAGLALGYVKRRHQAAGTQLVVGDPAAPLARATIVASPVRSDALPPTGEFE